MSWPKSGIILNILIFKYFAKFITHDGDYGWVAKRLRTLMFSEQILSCLILHSLDAYDNRPDLMNKEITFSPKTILDSLQMTQYDEYHFLHLFPLIK